MDQPALNLEHPLNRSLHIAGRTLSSAGNLVNHDIRVRQSVALSLGAGCKQNGSHARRDTHTVGGNIAGHKLHRIVNRETGGNRATGGIDVKVDITLGILHLQKQQLRNDAVCYEIIDRSADENDAIFEQSAINVIPSFLVAVPFDDCRRVIVAVRSVNAVGHSLGLLKQLLRRFPSCHRR